MYFYEVWVRSQRYHKNTPLTYAFARKLATGTLVRVPMQREAVIGVISACVSKPSFACKQISAVLPFAPLPQETLALMSWLLEYYPSSIGATTQLVIPPGLKETIKKADVGSTLSKTSDELRLNDEQQAAVDAMHTPGTYVLHGRTGSGKTRVYAALARQALQSGKSALILSPEISLSPQLAAELTKYVEAEVIVLHSKLTEKERREAWITTITSEKPLVIVGPRSALFAPVRKIGLIVLDESHEPAYKQEQQPHYYAPRVAARLASLHEAILVQGSATPLVSEYFVALQKKRPILQLRGIAGGIQSPVVHHLVDMKDREQFRESSQLSTPLISAIRQALKDGAQTMLYLNRRGTARLMLCNSCGWQATCPHCDVPLAYHGDMHAAICHTCGYRESPQSFCPICHNPDIIYRSAGTKAIVDEAQRLFPDARIQRFDTDNLKAERLETHYAAVRRGDVDILVGTQLLAKGLDLPRLTTLGIVLADSSLAIPDFTSQERTYQLIQQVLGRIGRGHSEHATAVIQTYAPENRAIQAALTDDWKSFYAQEIAERQAFMFPPFCYMAKLLCRRASSVSAQRAATDMADTLRSKFGNDVIIEGPAPAFHEKVGSKYEWQLNLKTKNRRVLLEVIRSLPNSGWTYDIDPINLL